jgi:hypothetical protein
MNRTEAELLLGLKNEQKKASAFSEIVRLYQERLYWHIRKMVLSHDDANDVLQNTFIKAWNGLDGFRGDSQISTWFYKIATNETHPVSVQYGNDAVWRPDYFLPDCRAAGPGPLVADRQGEAAHVAVPALSAAHKTLLAWLHDLAVLAVYGRAPSQDRFAEFGERR